MITIPSFFARAKAYLAANQVLLSSTVAAVVMIGQQAVKAGQTDLKVIGYAMFVQLLGIVAHQWMPQGRGLTTVGILTTLLGVFHDQLSKGGITWSEFFMSVLIALGSAASRGLQIRQQKPSDNEPR